MNNINIGDIIELNDSKSYIVLSSVMYDGDNFLYLANVDDQKEQELGIVIIENDKLRIEFIDNNDLENKEIITKLMDLFKNDMNKYLSNDLINE